jgi:repressor LexA
VIAVNIGNRLKQRRLEIGLSVDELAEKINKNRATIYRYENNEIENVPSTILEKLATALNTTPVKLLGYDVNAKNTLIPVYGVVAAGIPIEAVENVLDYEEISQEVASKGEHFALKIKGQSMDPKFSEGDVVIVRKQSTVDNGDIAIIIVNGNDATCKKVVKQESGISLVSLNTAYQPIFYTNDEIHSIPVTVLGKVVELRAKF